MHTCVRWFHVLFFGVCDVLQLVVVMCTLLFSMAATVYTAPWSYGMSSAPPRVEVVSGLVQEDNFAPSRRLGQNGLEALKLSTGGGARVNTPGAPAVAKQTKPNNSDSLQVQVEPVVPTP